MTGMWLYALELEGGHYYIGISADIDHRISQHFKGRGAKFTRLHKPISVLKRTQCDPYSAKRLERELVLEYRSKYGDDKVQGGKFTQC